MSMELVFCDIDGTLCVPRYRDGDRYVVGFSDEGWAQYCRRTGKDGYADCIPVQPVVRYLTERKAQGAELYVLSTSYSEEETAAKVHFVKEHFPELFRDVITVDSDDEKLTLMREMAGRSKVGLEDCEIVEDTYRTILKANELGIRTTHISAIVCDL